MGMWVKKEMTPAELRKFNKRMDALDRLVAAAKAHPIYGAAWQQVLDVAAAYNLIVGVSFRRMKGSYCTRLRENHVIIFGYQCLDMYAEEGYWEYPSLADLVPDPAPVGADAARWLALHEMAHILVRKRGLRKPGQVHKQAFRDAYSELISHFMTD